MKQILVMRKDLGMKTGKMCAQAAHASMKATLVNFADPRVKEWLEGKFTKIAVGVNSEEELLAVYNNARAAGLIAELVTDAGLTVFNGVPTNTCIAVGPDTHENLQPITGELKLL
jgi:peptidyl-tRNA hydrolase, PTH2 family